MPKTRMDKCYYPDYEGGFGVAKSHCLGADGFCNICGEYDEQFKILEKKQNKIMKITRKDIEVREGYEHIDKIPLNPVSRDTVHSVYLGKLCIALVGLDLSTDKWMVANLDNKGFSSLNGAIKGLLERLNNRGWMATNGV